MNLLREIRRVKKRSVPARIMLLLSFSVIFIITTYAWFSTQKDVNIGGLKGYTTAWDVSYYINEDENRILDEIATFTIDEFYPGMPDRTDVVHIYNLGTASTNIKYELISVKVFGQEVLDTLKTTGEIQTDTTTNTTNLFSKDTAYPFKISYTYDKDYLNGQYINVETTPNAKATFQLHVNWDYDVENGNDSQNAAKDVLDTKFGKDAYEFYQDAANDPTKAVEIKVKITSSMIHPSLET